jgi:hypothetical protein
MKAPDFLKYFLVLVLLTPSINFKKEIKPSELFMSTFRIIDNYQDGIERKIVKHQLDNNMLSYKFISLDSLNSKKKEEKGIRDENKELEQLRKKMIITSITKEWFDYNWINIREKNLKTNPKNDSIFNFENIEYTINVLFNLKEKYNLNWKTATAHSLCESVFNQMPYGALDELGWFHLRIKTARNFFKYVRKKFKEDEDAKEILGKRFDKEKLKDPEYNSLFYLYLMDAHLKNSEKIDHALRKYNAGGHWKKEKIKKYSDKIEKILGILTTYENYSRKNPEGFAFFYLMTLFPEFKVEKITIKRDFWSENSIYGNETVWRSFYKINKKGYFNLINDKEKMDSFEKHYKVAREFVKNQEK